MSFIDRINSTSKNKYYISCMVPLLRDVILREHLPIYTSLLANDGLYCIPNYCVDKNSDSFSNLRYTKKLKYISLFELLSISVNVNSFTTFEDGIDYIKKQLLNGKEVIVCVTTYHLPYSENYHTPKYLASYPDPILGITNHNVAVTNLSYDKIEIYYTTPKTFRGWIDIADFKAAWMTDKSVKELEHIIDINKLVPYSYYRVTCAKVFSESEICMVSLRLMKTILSEYLTGTTIHEDEADFYFGHLSNEELLKDLGAYIDSEKSELINKYFLCLIEQRISRYLFRDFYEDICVIYNPFVQYLQQVRDLTTKFDIVIARFSSELLRDSIDSKRLHKSLRSLTELFACEKELYEKLFLNSGNFDVFLRHD